VRLVLQEVQAIQVGHLLQLDQVLIFGVLQMNSGISTDQ
jgi:hypothetical protein